MQPNTIKIDDVEYVQKDSVAPVIKGNRAVIVVDRGWIFAGNITRKDGRILISNAIHVFKWESVGFAGMIENTKKADLRRIADVDLPEGAEIFCVPVHNSWGLK
jgi:hypothetical protein